MMLANTVNTATIHKDAKGNLEYLLRLENFFNLTSNISLHFNSGRLRSKFEEQFEDARTKRGSSHIGCKLRKIAKTLCPCLYFTHSCCVFQCLLHMF